MIDYPAWTNRKAIEFDAKGLEILRNPGVYLYVKEDKSVYVGSGHNVIGRALARNHHRKLELLEGTSLLIFPCNSYAEAVALEKHFTAELQPILNERNLLQVDRLAQVLGITEHHARELCKDYRHEAQQLSHE